MEVAIDVGDRDEFCGRECSEGGAQPILVEGVLLRLGAGCFGDPPMRSAVFKLLGSLSGFKSPFLGLFEGGEPRCLVRFANYCGSSSTTARLVRVLRLRRLSISSGTFTVSLS